LVAPHDAVKVEYFRLPGLLRSTGDCQQRAVITLQEDEEIRAPLQLLRPHYLATIGTTGHWVRTTFVATTSY
jgi:hypothetical protein